MLTANVDELSPFIDFCRHISAAVVSTISVHNVSQVMAAVVTGCMSRLTTNRLQHWRYVTTRAAGDVEYNWSVFLAEWCTAWLPGYVHPHDWGSEVTDMDTKALHALLSFASWTRSAMGMPVRCLPLSVQRLRGLPRCLFPAMMPCRTYVQRLSARTTMAEVP